jgi:epoxyqueuosine reductase
MGNRIFGCDDCQLFCPWNKFARPSEVGDFAVRHSLDACQLVDLFGWSAEQWQQRTAGSAIRRAGYEGWLRNIAVALGNAPTEPAVVTALRARLADPSAVVREHVLWALRRHGQTPPSAPEVLN